MEWKRQQHLRLNNAADGEAKQASVRGADEAGGATSEEEATDMAVGAVVLAEGGNRDLMTSVTPAGEKGIGLGSVTGR